MFLTGLDYFLLVFWVLRTWLTWKSLKVRGLPSWQSITEWAVSQDCGCPTGICKLVWISLKNPTLKNNVANVAIWAIPPERTRRRYISCWWKKALSKEREHCQKSLVLGWLGRQWVSKEHKTAPPKGRGNIWDLMSSVQ